MRGGEAPGMTLESLDEVVALLREACAQMWVEADLAPAGPRGTFLKSWSDLLFAQARFLETQAALGLIPEEDLHGLAEFPLDVARTYLSPRSSPAK